MDAFLDRIADSEQRVDAKKLRAIIGRLSGESAMMWGPSIVGFGRFHCKHARSHESDMCRVDFSPRSRELAVSIVPGFETPLLAKPSKHRTGKTCLYIKRLADVDKDALEQLIARTLGLCARNIRRAPVVHTARALLASGIKTGAGTT